MTFDKDTSAGYLVNHVARLFASGLKDRIAPLGLTIGQFPILLELWIGDGVTQRELLKNLALEQATLANTLARMERDGLIVRTPHPSDRRAKIVRLTDKAKATRDDAYAAASETNDQAMSGFSAEERRQFVEFMQRIVETLKT